MILYTVLSDFNIGECEEDDRQCVFSSKEKAKEWLLGNPHLKGDFYENFMDEDEEVTLEIMKKILEECLNNETIIITKVDFDPQPIEAFK